MKRIISVAVKSLIVVGAIIFGWLFISFLQEARYLHTIRLGQKNTGDLVFLKRTVSSLRTEYENLSRETFSARASADFIAHLPVLAEFSGISRFTMSSRGSRTEGRQEILTMEMTLQGRFAAIASFIDILERARLPIQIETLIMEQSLRQVQASMTMRIYYRR